jgi:hypothetical protein
MSFASTATTPERSSQQYHLRDEIPTKIVEDDEEDFEDGRSDNGGVTHETGVVSKHQYQHHPQSLMHRQSGARISALGVSRRKS